MAQGLLQRAYSYWTTQKNSQPSVTSGSSPSYGWLNWIHFTYPKDPSCSAKILYEILISTLHATCYDHLICPDVVDLQHYTQKAHIKNVNKRGNVHVTEHSGAFMQPLIMWKNNKYYIFQVCICSLSYPAYNVHALYCHLWPAWVYNIFPHYLVNSMIFGKKLLNKIFFFPSTTLAETLLIVRRTEWDL